MTLPQEFTITFGSGSYGIGKIDGITLNTSTSGALSLGNYPASASFTTYPTTWTTTGAYTTTNGTWIQGSVPSGINYTNAVSVKWNVKHLLDEMLRLQHV